MADGGVSISLMSEADQLAAIGGRGYHAAHQETAQYSIGWIVLLALVAGMVLNVMPCVLPVIPLKVLSLVQQAHGDRRLAVLHALAFSSGIIVLFVVLAIVLKSFSLFYGQQFQSPIFLGVMAMVIVALGLSMIGVWTMNPPQAVYRADDLGGGGSYLGSFVHGLMATLLATPCSGPFLGSVLAWAWVQPTWLTALALALVGVGMSLPYLALAAFPAMLNRLPRAGRWSELLKQGLGILMLGVAVYIITLIPNVTLWPWMMMGAVLVGFVCWGWGQIPTGAMAASRGWGIRLIVVVVGVGAGMGLWMWATATTQKVDTGWQPFNMALLDAGLKAGRPVVVDWTADWCINCRSLDALVLSTEPVRKAFAESNALLLKADLSSDNPLGITVE